MPCIDFILLMTALMKTGLPSKEPEGQDGIQVDFLILVFWGGYECELNLVFVFVYLLTYLHTRDRYGNIKG